MPVGVPLQYTLVGEGLPTELASIWPLSSMGSHMAEIVGFEFLGKGFSANVTNDLDFRRATDGYVVKGPATEV